jgi:hypothetical protein
MGTSTLSGEAPHVTISAVDLQLSQLSQTFLKVQWLIDRSRYRFPRRTKIRKRH